MAEMILNNNVIPLPAETDLSGKQYYLVKLGSGDGVTLATANAECIGTLQNKPAAGETAAVATGIIIKVVAGGNVAFGDDLVADSSGKAIKRTSESNVLGKALSAGTDGAIIPMLVRPVTK